MIYYINMIIAPSLLAADWTSLIDEVKSCERAQVEYLHLDVMDGHFVPPITFGAKFISDLRSKTSLFLDVHLMVSRPQDHVEAMLKAGADAISFHIEASNFSYRLISHMRNLDESNHIKLGIALNPQTNIESIIPLLPYIDMVIVMGVEPGYGGQAFIPDMLLKITMLQELKSKYDNKYLISIDGGVNKDNISELMLAGADILVMGSAFFQKIDEDRLKIRTFVDVLEDTYAKQNKE